MAFAGDLHIVAARQTHFYRFAQLTRGDGTQTRHACRLRLFAAKATAHAPHINGDFVHGDAHHFRHQLLHFGGILRRGEHLQAVIFAGDHQRRLGFQIEMFLTADVKFALNTA